MITITELLIIMATLPVPYEHAKETKTQRFERLRPVASAIHGAAQRATCYGRVECSAYWSGSKNQAIAALVSTGWWESRFAQRIIDHKCRKNECDSVLLPDGTVFHKSAGAWQQQAGGVVTVLEWQRLPGSPRRQAWAAVRTLGRSKDACKTPAGMFSMYGTGKHCGWAGAVPRVRTYNKVLRKLDAIRDVEAMVKG